MRVGALQDYIEIWRKTLIKNEFGEMTESWTIHSYINAFVHHQSGNQLIQNSEIFDLIRLRVTIRNQSDITEMDRIKVNGKMYQVDFLQLKINKRFIEIWCTRINE